MRFLEEPRTSVEVEMPLAHPVIKTQSISQAFRLRDPAAAGLVFSKSVDTFSFIISPFLN